MNESGSSRWGYVQVGYARHWVCHRLVVYPPGISEHEVRWMRIWRAAPFIAVAVVLASAYVAETVGDAGLAGLFVGIVLALALVAVVEHQTHRVRTQTRTLEAWTGYGADAAARSTRREICVRAAVLRDADSRLRAGAITPVEHEMIWARCHGAIPSAQRRRHALT